VSKGRYANGLFTIDVNPWAVLDMLPDYIAIVDSEGVIRYLNATWYQLILERAVGYVGFTVGSSYISSFRMAFGNAGANVEMMEDGLRSVLSGSRDTFMIEYPYRHPEGQRWFSATITPTYIADRSRGALIRQVDNTDYKLATEALTAASTSKALAVNGGHY